ncbi:uncharacterized protein LOC127841125 [Dreissena polymorpha]|uniref:Uncharacterized protein n=1 Tax=Dreissena polymorpha TaxID=45954 RepID=A0A9D4ES39_DREPO|nr:uncharacterized protein LOC127841125 [Dreissena polymorpha]KAH3784709.1 hypothetical protein DPMN_162673 [Dreissena polymorpha]
MDNASTKIIRLSPMSHLTTVVRVHPFVAVSILAVALIGMIFASSTSVVFALTLLLIYHTGYVDPRIQQLEDQLNNEAKHNCCDSSCNSPTPKNKKNSQVSKKFLQRQIAQAEFVALRCAKTTFRKAKHCCETIDGILTICDQDLAPASTILNEKWISTITSSSVLIYTTEKFEHHFEEASSAKTHLMSITDVVEDLQNTHEFALIVLDCHSLTSVVEMLKDAKLPSAGILVVGESDTFQNISGITLLSTHPDTIVKDADILLERCALALLKILHSELYESEKSFSEQKRMCFLDIDDLITTLFRNSAIPRSDRLETQMQKIKYPSHIDGAIEKLVSLPAIIGCLKKRGALQIYVSHSTNKSAQDNIRRELEIHGIDKYNFVYVKSKNLFSSGDSIFGGRGTLGGFVKKLDVQTVDIHAQESAERADAGRDSANTTDFTVAALISRHVVHETNAEMLTVGTNQNAIGRIGTLNESDAVDILPVDVDSVYASECDPRFLNELNVKMFSRLKTSAAIQELNGKPVHIWSAGSKPGFGLIVEQNFRTSNGHRIIIRDRRRDTPFAREGDSGAMICYEDPVSEELYAVAMLVSDVQPEHGGGV